MITTFTGENTFGLQIALRKRLADFLAEYGDLAIERLDGEEVEFSAIQESLTSLPFLVDRKMVVLRRPSANKPFLAAAEQLIGNIPDTTDLIIVEPKLDKRLTYYKLLKKTDFQEFRELDVAGLARWLVTTAKEHDSTISFDVAQYLVERVGANQQILSNELDKLVLYNQRITKDTINLLTQSTPQSTIFQLLEAAYGGNARKTLQLYQEQRSLKVEPPQIIAMLTWQLHVLALIKTGGERTADVIANEASMSPFVVRKSQAIAQRISVVELKELIRELLTIDARSKRENLDADEALQNYLLRLASS